jgi:hypothetical protein
MSAIPDWVEEADKKNIAELRQLNDAAPALERPVRDSFHTAPGWREVAFELTCSPDPAHPWDPEVVKAIWRFDSGLVPMWVNWVFAPPGDDAGRVVFGRHVLGRYEPHRKGDAPEFRVQMPTMPCQGIKFERPNVLELVLMMPTNTQYPDAPDLPGDYIPFNWAIVEWLRERYKASQKGGKEIARDYINAQREATEKAQAARDDEMEYRRKDLEKYVNKKLEQVSEVELKNHFLRDKERKRRIQVSMR